MNKKSLTIGFTLSCVIAFGIGRAEAGELKAKGTFSGTFTSTQIDTLGDGQKAALAIIGTKGTLGPGTVQGVNEYVFSGPATCTNGNDGFEFKLLHSVNPAAPAQFVTRIDSTGDLIFSEQTSGTICFDPVTLIQFFSATFKITGGTGRFEGATGTSESSGTAKTLFEDAAG